MLIITDEDILKELLFEVVKNNRECWVAIDKMVILSIIKLKE